MLGVPRIAGNSGSMQLRDAEFHPVFLLDVG